MSKAKAKAGADELTVLVLPAFIGGQATAKTFHGRVFRLDSAEEAKHAAHWLNLNGIAANRITPAEAERLAEDALDKGLQ